MADEYLNALMEAMQAPTKQYEEEDPYLIANAGLSRVDYSGIEDPLQKALAGLAKGFTMGATRRLGQDNVRSKEKEYESKLLEALNNRGQEIDDPLISRRINQIDIADRARQRAIDEDLRKRQLEADIDVQKVQNMERGKENVKMDIYNQAKLDADNPLVRQENEKAYERVAKTREFEDLTGKVKPRYDELANAFSSLEASDENNRDYNANLETTMLYSVVLILDPDGTVREGDKKETIEQSKASVKATLAPYISKWNNGEKFTKETRASLMDLGRKAYQSKVNNVRGLIDNQKQVLANSGIPTRDFETYFQGRLPDADKFIEDARERTKKEGNTQGTYFGLVPSLQTGYTPGSLTMPKPDAKAPQVEAPQQTSDMKLEPQSGVDSQNSPKQPLNFGKTFNAMLQAESGGKHFDDKGNVITSPKGAKGVGQLMPATARELEKEYGFPEGSSDTDPEINKILAGLYANKLRNRYKDDDLLMVSAYNYGMGYVDKLLSETGGNKAEFFKRLPKETRDYYIRVKKNG